MEKTLALIKPDGVKKGIKPYEIIIGTDLKIIKMKTVYASIEQAKLHYIEHSNETWYNTIVNSLIHGPIIVLIIEGSNAVVKIRNKIGSRYTPNTLRYKYSHPYIKELNAIHGSDSVDSAKREINIWF